MGMGAQVMYFINMYAMFIFILVFEFLNENINISLFFSHNPT